MNRNRIDAMVAASVGCTADYVRIVRLKPDRYKSEMSKRILEELDRINGIYEHAKREALQPS